MNHKKTSRLFHPESKERLSAFHTAIDPMLARLEGQEMQ
jgi:hypothetical protein